MDDKKDQLKNFFNHLKLEYRLRELDPAQGEKPLDFGGHGINGSVNRDGRIIAINTYHPEHGYITLTSAPPFPEDKRYDPAAVRAYRKSLATQEGFGFEFTVPIIKREAYLIEDAIPYIVLTLENGVVARCLTVIQNPSLIQQIWDISDFDLIVNLTGKGWFMRCMYTQLTEGGTLPMPDVRVNTIQGGRHTLIESDSLDTSVITAFMQATVDEVGELTFSGTHNHNVGRIGVSFKQDLINADENYTPIDLALWRSMWQSYPLTNHPLDLAIRRALVYGLNCCVPLQNDDEAICILTDHMLLPLSWNRDAYYVARALLAWTGNEAETHKLVFGHLVWMFERAGRVDGTWGRSYLANGKVKDKGYQLDQQIFPLLELCDYIEKSGDHSAVERFKAHIQPVINVLMAHKHPQKWLFPTDETPGDDPIAYPYHLSSHILIWHTLNRLAELNLDLDIDFSAMATGVRDAIDANFIAEKDGVQIYAYAADGENGYHFYHDANDVPLVLAPVWGMCSADDAVWRATLDFAFSPANIGGFYDIALGSVHTPAPWALGDAQEWLVAKLLKDETRETQVIERLSKAMQWDGALPEAYSANDFSVISRHWFAWPNALLAWFILEYAL
ncbi:MAG: glycoside hydrolase family 125 protein [Aggregatilineales bacterium]